MHKTKHFWKLYHGVLDKAIIIILISGSYLILFSLLLTWIFHNEYILHFAGVLWELKDKMYTGLTNKSSCNYETKNRIKFFWNKDITTTKVYLGNLVF